MSPSLRERVVGRSGDLKIAQSLIRQFARCLVLLLSSLLLPPSSFEVTAAPDPIYADTKTHAITRQSGATSLDFKGVTLTLGHVTIADSAGIRVIDLGSINGTKVGDTGNKIGFLGATPIARPTGNVFTALVNLGLVTTPTLQLSNITDLSSSLSGKVSLTGNETIAGIKTFSSAPVVPSAAFPQTAIVNLVTDLAARQPLNNANLTPIAALTTTAFGRDFLTLADEADARDKLDLAEVAQTGDYNDLSGLPVLAVTEAPVANFFLTSYNEVDGRFAKARPAFSDLLGTATTDQIPALPAAKVTSGEFDLLRIPALPAAKVTSGEFDPLRIPALDFSKITTGIVPKVQLPAAAAYEDEPNVFTQPQDFISHTTGSVSIRSLATPGAPIVTTTGVPGATTWSYRIVAKLPDGTVTAGGLTGSTATGNATLDTNNFNNISWTAVPGATAYDVYRTVAGLSPTTLGKIATVTATTYQDKGAAGDSAAVPNTNTTGRLGWLADNTSDIGDAAAARPRDVNASRNLNAGATITAVTSAITGNSTVGGNFTATGPITGPLRDKGGQVFNVVAFATGTAGIPDDAFDDTAAVTDAISAAGSNPVLFFPEGTWLINDVQPPTGSKIIGAGSGVTVLKKLSGVSNGIVLRFTNTTSNIVVRDLTLDGNRGNINVTPLQFDFVLGIGGTHTLIENVEITRGESIGAVVGDTFFDATGATFRNCWIHSNGGTIDATGYGSGIFAGGNVLASNLTIENCLIENNYNTVTQPNDSTGINITVAFGAKVINNTFRNNYNVGGGQVTCNSGGPGIVNIGCIVTGNHVSRTGSFGGDSTNGIEIQSRGFIINGNVIDGFSTAGINPVISAGGGTISDNTIRGGPTAIRLYGGGNDPISNVVIADNVTSDVSVAVDLNTFNRTVSIHGNDFSTATDSYTVFGGNYSTLHASVVDYDNHTIFSSPREVRTATGTTVSLPSSFAQTSITFIDLPKGTWDVYAGAVFNKAATTKLTATWTTLSLTNNFLDQSQPGEYVNTLFSFPPTDFGASEQSPSGILPVKRYRLDALTRIYLVCMAQFDTSTMTVTGKITAKPR